MVTPFFFGTGAEPGVGRPAATDGLGGGVWPVVQAVRQTMATMEKSGPRLRPRSTSIEVPLETRLSIQSLPALTGWSKCRASCESALQGRQRVRAMAKRKTGRGTGGLGKGKRPTKPTMAKRTKAK